MKRLLVFASFAFACAVVWGGGFAPLRVAADFSVVSPPDRAVADVPFAQDLRTCTGVEFDLTIPDVAQFSGVSCYFKSGAGWYCFQAKAGGNGEKVHVRLRRSAAGVEGAPASWGAVTTFRIGGWRAGTSSNASFTVENLRPFGGVDARVALVLPLATAKKARDAKALLSFADDFLATCEALGVAVSTIADEDVDAASFASARCVVLPYNTALPTNAAAAVADFAQKGGKLFACYALPPAAARALGLRSGEYVQSNGRFGGFAAAPDDALPGQPAFAVQRSWMANRVAVPSNACVRAWWGGKDSSRTDVPALVETPGGLYLSHVWHGGVTDDRCRFLASALVRLLPELAAPAAAALAQRRAEREKNRAWLKTLSGKDGEWRGIWCHDAYGLAGAGGWDESIRRVKAGGFNAILANLAWGAAAYYPSRVLPCAKAVAERGDALEQLKAACRKHGVECHVWKVCFNAGDCGDKAFLAQLEKEGRLQMDAQTAAAKDGAARSASRANRRLWLCPSHPANKKLEVDALVELAGRGVDGIHLDYIRYPGADFCCCPGCRARFEKFLGAPVSHWPVRVSDRDAKSEVQRREYARWLDFRAEQISDVVRETAAQVRKAAPGVKISAATFGGVTTCRAGVGQDWTAWCRAGWLDFVCPMNYVLSAGALESRLALQRARLPAGFCVRSGIGLSTQPSDVDAAAETARQILALRKRGETGFTVYALDARGDEALPLLGGGVTKAQSRKTKVQLWFDTEDYTWDRSNDAIRDLAQILSEEGVVGHFNVVGYLGKFLVDKRRFDVIDALKPHLVGTQTYLHSWHPNVTEATDLADYDAAYRIALAQESEGAGMLKAAFGIDRLEISCFPGNGSSPVALDVYADMGIPVHGGLGALDDPRKRGQVFFMNQRHVLYNAPFSLEAFSPGAYEKLDLDAQLARAAACKMVTFYMHPHMIVRKRHWDKDNLDRGNHVPFGQWVEPEALPEATTRLFLARFRAFVRRIKQDPRFEFTDCRRLAAEEPPRKPILRSDVPALRAALAKDFRWLETPASWCVADCFQAAVKFLRGETRHEPGKVHGFLEAPRGVTAPVRVKAADLRAAAQEIDLSRHLPPAIKVGDVAIGPADFLFAALEALETNAAEVRVEPREQLGDVAAAFPRLAKFTHVGGWIYTPDFKDRYLSDRLRRQFWTMRETP